MTTTSARLSESTQPKPEMVIETESTQSHRDCVAFAYLRLQTTTTTTTRRVFVRFLHPKIRTSLYWHYDVTDIETQTHTESTEKHKH